MEHLKGGEKMDKKTQKRSINFPVETIKALDKLAVKNNTTTSELVREFVNKGLEIESYKENVDFITSIIRQELNAIYNVNDIKNIVEHNVDRLAKMLMKTGKINSGAFFILIYVLMNITHKENEFEFTEMYDSALKMGVDYMQKKDFEINDYLFDIDNIFNQAKNLS